MQVKNYRLMSAGIGHEMNMRRYGSRGIPFLVFPPQDGKYTDFEGFGMVECVKDHIEAGRLCIYSIDSIDRESWSNHDMHPADRGRHHELYDAFIVKEVVPLIKSECTQGEIYTSGCSMGGYHASNFFFRHPDIFAGTVSLSGIHDLSLYVGDYVDEVVYFNSPLHFLPNLRDSFYLEHLRKAKIFICAGLGRWDELMVEQARRMEQVLKALKVPAVVDIWGWDVDHDWPWWKKQFPYFLEKIVGTSDKEQSSPAKRRR